MAESSTSNSFLYIIGASCLILISTLFNNRVTPVGSIASLISFPNGTYEVEAEAVTNRDIVTLIDSSFSLEATCANKSGGCVGAGLIKVQKSGSAYRVLGLIKKPTRVSLNKILDAEAVDDTLIRILIKDDSSEEWIEIALNKSNVEGARDLILNKNLEGWSYDSNTSSLIKVGE